MANAGDEHAALLLGMLYDRGIGIAADPAKAIYWYQHAGDSPISQFILGTYTSEGAHIAQNKDNGLAQLLHASAGHFPYADFNLAILKQQAGKEFLPI